MTHDCKKCVYYITETNLCNGFTYICECINDFCPEYTTEEMMKQIEEMRRKEREILKNKYKSWRFN